MERLLSEKNNGFLSWPLRAGKTRADPCPRALIGRRRSAGIRVPDGRPRRAAAAEATAWPVVPPPTRRRSFPDDGCSPAPLVPANRFRSVVSAEKIEDDGGQLFYYLPSVGCDEAGGEGVAGVPRRRFSCAVRNDVLFQGVPRRRFICTIFARETKTTQLVTLIAHVMFFLMMAPVSYEFCSLAVEPGASKTSVDKAPNLTDFKIFYPIAKRARCFF